MLIVQSQPLLDADHPSTIVVPLTTNLIEDTAPLRIRVPAADKLRQATDFYEAQRPFLPLGTEAGGNSLLVCNHFGLKSGL